MTEIISYRDYKHFISGKVHELSVRQQSVLSAVCAQFLFEQYADFLKADLSEDEITITVNLLDCVWNGILSDPPDHHTLSALQAACEGVGMDDDGDPRDLSSESIDILSGTELAARCQLAPSMTHTIHAIEIITDGIDRYLDEHDPDYQHDSLEKMFTYPEMKTMLIRIVKLIECIQQGDHSRTLSAMLA